MNQTCARCARKNAEKERKKKKVEDPVPPARIGNVDVQWAREGEKRKNEKEKKEKKRKMPRGERASRRALVQKTTTRGEKENARSPVHR